MFGQERENKTRDVVVLLVQGKMAGVEQLDLGIRQLWTCRRIRSAPLWAKLDPSGAFTR